MRLLINTIYQPFHHILSQWEDPPDFITHPIMFCQIHILIHTNIHCIKPNYFCNYVSKFVCIIVPFSPEHTVVFHMQNLQQTNNVFLSTQKAYLIYTFPKQKLCNVPSLLYKSHSSLSLCLQIRTWVKASLTSMHRNLREQRGHICDKKKKRIRVRFRKFLKE